MPWQWYRTLFKSQVCLNPFAQGWSGGSTPFFLSLSLYYLSSISLFMLKLEISSNMWYHNDFLMFLLSMFISFWWWSIDQYEVYASIACYIRYYVWYEVNTLRCVICVWGQAIPQLRIMFTFSFWMLHVSRGHIPRSCILITSFVGLCFVDDSFIIYFF